MSVIDKRISAADAVAKIQSGSTVMLGGFFYSGAPFDLVRALTKRKGGLKDITLITNDACSEFVFPDAIGNDLIATGMFKKIICTYMGHNHAAMKLAKEGKLELEVLPMGTFAERIRAGGAGLGGFLTPTGLGTLVEDGKQIIHVNGRDYLLELPLHADVALVYGSIADRYGNVSHRGIAGNFNTVMATAADYVIVEAKGYLDKELLDPNSITIPAPYVDAIVLQEEGA